MILREIKIYLNKTKSEKEGQKVELARTLARWAVNPDLNQLELMERLKSRLLKPLTDDGGKEKSFAFWLRDNLFGREKIVKEVGKMTIEDAVEIPEKLVEAVAEALIPPNRPRDELKGWFNKFVKLENLNSVDRFFTEIERIISRATYDREKVINKVYWAGSEELQKLRQLVCLQDDRKFRAFKATFLLWVLAKLRIGGSTTASSDDTNTEEDKISQ